LELTNTDGISKRAGRQCPWYVLTACALLVAARGATAQESGLPAEVLHRLDVLEQRLQASEDALKSRTSELESALARIQQLEGRVGVGTTETPALALDGREGAGGTTETPALAVSPAAIVEPVSVVPAVSLGDTVHDHNGTEIASTPRMSIRGFADVRFGDEPYTASPNSFAFGQLDLYITSRLSDRTSVLMETVFESDTTNALGVDIERVLLQHRINRYLKFEAGRNHTAIGYYNMAFHHGTWFQTATVRPFLFAFEDEGGMLPIHTIGLRATGAVPGRGLGLEYFAEIGNGRNYAPGQEQVQNRINFSGGLSQNFALRSSPDAVPGLHVGLSYFRQRTQWSGVARFQQSIFAGFAVYDRGHVEFLNEVVWMRHAQSSGVTTSIPAGYSQISYRLGNVHPYARFEYLNAGGSDPIARLLLPSPGVREQASGGIRYDFTEFAAIKLQYGRLLQGSLVPVSLFATQVAFTF